MSLFRITFKHSVGDRVAYKGWTWRVENIAFCSSVPKKLQITYTIRNVPNRQTTHVYESELS